MNNNHSLTQEQLAEIARANALQVRRERWAEALAKLPQPKTDLEAFPYESFDAMLDDAGRKEVWRQMHRGTETQKRREKRSI